MKNKNTIVMLACLTASHSTLAQTTESNRVGVPSDIKNSHEKTWFIDSSFGLGFTSAEYGGGRFNNRAAYYLEKIETGRGPYGLAEVFAATDSWQFFYDYVQDTNTFLETDGHRIGVQRSLFLDNDWFLIGGASISEYDGLDTNGMTLGGGKQWSENQRLSAQLTITQEDLIRGDSTNYRTDIEYKHLWNFNSRHSLLMQTRLTTITGENESRDYTDLIAYGQLDYFIGKRWSIGGAVEAGDSDADYRDFGRFEVNSQYYFNSTFATKVALSAEDGPDRGTDYLASLVFTFRF